MNTLQRGSVSLLALLFSSFLLSLGGAGAAATYFRTNPSDFMTELRAYLTANIDMTELVPLEDITPTEPENEEVIQDASVSVSETPTAATTPTPMPETEDDDGNEIDDDRKEEQEIKIKLNASGKFEIESDD